MESLHKEKLSKNKWTSISKKIVQGRGLHRSWKKGEENLKCFPETQAGLRLLLGILQPKQLIYIKLRAFLEAQVDSTKAQV